MQVFASHTGIFQRQVALLVSGPCRSNVPSGLKALTGKDSAHGCRK